jgi:hypothetical protein
VRREVGSRENQPGVALTRFTDGFVSVLAAGVGNSVEELWDSSAAILPESRGERGKRRWGIGGCQRGVWLGSGARGKKSGKCGQLRGRRPEVGEGYDRWGRPVSDRRKKIEVPVRVF